MSEETTVDRSRRPWHLWLVGVLALLWNLIGAFDYLMTEMRVDWYMSQFTPEQLDYFYGFPAWAVASWAVAVWGAVLGSVLLLLRKRWAAPVFLVSFLAMCLTSVYNFLLSDGLEVMGGPGALIFTGVIFVIALGLWLYARAMARRGVLI